MKELSIGLVINPIAGVGAALAWKGTDDIQKAWKAIDDGMPQPIWNIVSRALTSIPKNISINWILASNYPIDLPQENKIILSNFQKYTNSETTHQLVKELTNHDLDLILFAGGDGTASDVAKFSKQIPIMGIPSGVKIYSPCFLHKPEDLGSFLQNWEGETYNEDLLDLDLNNISKNIDLTQITTSALIPITQKKQLGKISWSNNDTHTHRLIAERISEDKLLENSTILIGPGSTMKTIFEHLGHETTLLGVDIIQNNEIIIKDANFKDILGVTITGIWVSPIGNQGHVFGRGNRQIPASTINQLPNSQILIFSTLEKIRNTQFLYVDTGDPELDKKLQGYFPIITGYHEEIMRKIL